MRLLLGVTVCAAGLWAMTTAERLPAASCVAYDAAPTVFQGAAVLTMRDSMVHAGTTVIVAGGRIAWIGPDAQAQGQIPAGARRIDASGMTLLPGLADMHVHMDVADTALYLRYGVTQVREMNGSPAHLALRAATCAGRAFGPTMSVTGPLLAGVKQRYRHVLVDTPDSATRVVAGEAAEGYEAVKAYDGLSRPTYEAIVAAAAKARVPVYGHIPRDVGLDGVLAARQRSIEHLDQLINAIGSHDAPADSASMAAAARRIKIAGSWVTPTLAVEYGLSRAGAASYARDLDRPEMQHVDSGTRAWWASLSRSRSGGGPDVDEFPTERSRDYFTRKQVFVRALDRVGVPLLAGTDTPNPLMIPGFSLVDELIALNAAGLSRWRVLRMATRDASEFLGQADEFGTITRGARADLLLVRGDPTSDLSTLRAVQGVLVRGRWLPGGRR